MKEAHSKLTMSGSVSACFESATLNQSERMCLSPNTSDGLTQLREFRRYFLPPIDLAYLKA